MRSALYALLITTAAALAWTIARRRPEHRPIALALSVGLVADAGQALLIHSFPPNLDPSAPLRTGGRLIAAYLGRALYLAWPYALAAAATTVLGHRRAWPLALLYAAGVAVVVLGYSWIRFDVLRKTYLALELVALAFGVASLARWYAAGWRRGRAGKPEPADFTGRTAAMLVAGQFVIVVTGPYRFELFGESWAIAQIGYAILLSAVVLLELGEVITRAEP